MGKEAMSIGKGSVWSRFVRYAPPVSPKLAGVDRDDKDITTKKGGETR
jgi:hypothetical protein